MEKFGFVYRTRVYALVKKYGRISHDTVRLPNERVKETKTVPQKRNEEFVVFVFYFGYDVFCAPGAQAFCIVLFYPRPFGANPVWKPISQRVCTQWVSAQCDWPYVEKIHERVLDWRELDVKYYNVKAQNYWILLLESGVID